MNKIFNLEGVIDYKEQIKEDRIEIKIGQPRKPSCCPDCGGNRVWNHGEDGVREIKRIYSIKKDTIDEEKRKKLPSTHGLFKELRKSPKDWDEDKKEKIKKLFKLIPEIKQQYLLKEKLKKMYNKCDKPQAAKELKQIINNLPKLASESRSALTNHFHQILNYFDDRATNGFTEGIHTKVKLSKRISYGIKNLNVYVKKILLAFDELNSLGRVHAI